GQSSRGRRNGVLGLGEKFRGFGVAESEGRGNLLEQGLVGVAPESVKRLTVGVVLARLLQPVGRVETNLDFRGRRQRPEGGEIFFGAAPVGCVGRNAERGQRESRTHPSRESAHEPSPCMYLDVKPG